MNGTTRLLTGVAGVVAATVSVAFAGRYVQRQALPDIQGKNGATILPNGWQVSPAGTPIALPGDMPLTMVRSADGRFLLVNTAGYHDHSINLIDLATSKCVQSVVVAHDWAGMCLSPDGSTLYVSSGGAGGNKKRARKRAANGLAPKKTAVDEGAILRFGFAAGRLTPQAPVDIDSLDDDQQFVSGLASGPDGVLYIANIKNDTIYRYAADTTTPEISGTAGREPYGIVLSPDRATLAVSDWAEDAVRLLNAKTLKEYARIPVGSHPNQLVWGKDGRLFVANAGSNSVSVIHGAAVIETIKTSLEPTDPVGSTPDALALSPDGKRLYVANADNNDVAVIDTADARESRVLGFLPTAWYPSAVSVSDDGRKLFVGTAKGLTYRPNAPAHPDNVLHDAEVARQKQKFEYIGHILTGDVSVVDLPDAVGLAAATKQVLANVPHPPYHAPLLAAEDPFAKIKHVVYIIRENRTYDQVFGDMAKGNGDPNLCLFGATVTPNAHALASNYVLLDNLYCNSEVSQDGHQWCDAAYATDYTEKAWPLDYSSREAPPDEDDDLSQSPAGYIWNNCAKHGVTFRMYGEGSKFKSSPGAPPEFVGEKSLESHVSAAYSAIPWFTGARDLGRAKIFIDDLHADEKTDSWPQFTIMSLPEDHTQALTAKTFTPFAHVGENDEALGQIVDAVSHSKYWADTAIFVIEDDAQNGPDHVDAHRTVGLVISPYVRQGVDSTMYSQASFVHTIELILHLPTMTQYDRNATPLYASFTSHPNLTAYDTIAAKTDLEARNPAVGAGAVASAKLDLSAPDQADPDKLNAILWNALRPGHPMPAPVRGGGGTALLMEY